MHRPRDRSQGRETDLRVAKEFGLPQTEDTVRVTTKREYVRVLDLEEALGVGYLRSQEL